MATTLTFRNATTSVSFDLATETCCNCGVVFAMPVELVKQRRKDHGWFYCPIGHSQHYTENETERRLREAEERLAAEKGWSKHLESDLNDTKRQLTSTKGQLTKARNRSQAGVCLHCNRTFQNYARHMQTKHAPDSKETENA